LSLVITSPTDVVSTKGFFLFKQRLLTCVNYHGSTYHISTLHGRNA